MKLKMYSHSPEHRQVTWHMALRELNRLWAENTLSTVDQVHWGMISIMKAFNSTDMSRRREWEFGKMLQERSSAVAWLVSGRMISSKLVYAWLALKEKCDCVLFPEHSSVSEYIIQMTDHLTWLTFVCLSACCSLSAKFVPFTPSAMLKACKLIHLGSKNY